MDATAIIDYFASLKTWLDEQNKTQQRILITEQKKCRNFQSRGIFY